jgi:hypothetical protein
MSCAMMANRHVHSTAHQFAMAGGRAAGLRRLHQQVNDWAEQERSCTPTRPVLIYNRTSRYSPPVLDAMICLQLLCFFSLLCVGCSSL